MSRLALGVLLLALAVPAAAQDAAAWRDSAYRLSAEAQRIRDSLNQDDSELEAVASRSGLIASATSQYRAFAEEVLARFDAGRRRWFGTALPAASGFRITLRSGESWSFGRRIRSTRGLIIAGIPDGNEAFRLAPYLPKETLGHPEKAVQRLLGEYGRLMMSSAHDSIRAWLPDGLLMEIGTDARRERAPVSPGNGGLWFDWRDHRARSRDGSERAPDTDVRND